MSRPGGQGQARGDSIIRGAKRPSKKPRGRKRSTGTDRHAGTRTAGGGRGGRGGGARNMKSATDFPNLAEKSGKGSKDKKKRDYGDRKFKSPFRVRVGNLPCSTANMVTLSQYFASARPNSISIATSTSSPYECVGYAFLGFPASTHMVHCRDMFHGSEFMGREISVKLMGENIYIDDPMQGGGSGTKVEAIGQVIAEKGERPKEAERRQTTDATPPTPEGVLHPGQVGESNSREDAQNANPTPLVTGEEFRPNQVQEEKPEQEMAPKADITTTVEQDELHQAHAEGEKPAEVTQTALSPSHGGDVGKAMKTGKKAKTSNKSKRLKSKIIAPVTEGESDPGRAVGGVNPEWEEVQNAEEAVLQVAEGGPPASQAREVAPAVEDLHPTQAGEKPEKPKGSKRTKNGKKSKTAASTTKGDPSACRAQDEGNPKKDQSARKTGGITTQVRKGWPHPDPAGAQDKPKETRAAEAEAAESSGFSFHASRRGGEKPKKTEAGKNTKHRAQVAKDGGFPNPAGVEKPNGDDSVKKAMLAAQAVLGHCSAQDRAQRGKPRVKRRAEEGGAGDYGGKVEIPGKKRGRGEEMGQEDRWGGKGVPSKKHRR